MNAKPKNGFDECGSLIKELRLQHGLTQSDLAVRMGGKWEKTRVNKIESGNLNLTRASIHTFASALEIRPESLYLMCLKCQYPSLASGEIGALLGEIVDGLAEIRADPNDSI